MEGYEEALTRLAEEHDTWCVRATIGEDARPVLLLICACGKIVDRIMDPVYEDEIYELWSEHVTKLQERLAEDHGVEEEYEDEDEDEDDWCLVDVD